MTAGRSPVAARIPRTRRLLGGVLAAALAGSAAPAPADAATAAGELIEVFLVNGGPDPDARGRVRHRESAGYAGFEVDLERLAPGSYQLYVDGVLQHGFTATSAPLAFDFEDPIDATPDPGQSELLLDFDPLGTAVEIRSGATVHLSARLPGSAAQTGTSAPTPARSAIDTGSTRGDSLRVTLYNVGTLAGAAGFADLGQNGPNVFTVSLEDVGDASYELFVGGVKRGDIAASGGLGAIRFSSVPAAGELPLNFSVKGAAIEVRRQGVAILGRVFPTDVQSALGRFATETRTSQIRVNLRNAGVDLDAAGSVEWRSSKGVASLKVDARDLPAGTYRLFADGVEQGAAVADTSGSLRMLFESKLGTRALPLDFAVFEETVEIRNGSGQTVLEASVE
jgi:hypothetical protein